MNPEQPELLHNMSVPPKTVVRFEGLGMDNAPNLWPPPQTRKRIHGIPLRFRLDDEVRGLKPAQLLRLVDPTSRIRVHALAEPELARRIDARARELPLPDGCLVTLWYETDAAPWPDVLTTLAVLSKCTDTVWLRAKPPSLEVARARVVVSLLVPPAFAAAVPSAGGTAHG